MGRLLAFVALVAAAPGPAMMQAVPVETMPMPASGFVMVPPGARRPVTFELVHGVILFRATVAGRDAWAILDNRITQSLVDPVFAVAAGVAVGPPAGTVRTPTGTMARRQTADVTVVIPGQVSVRAPLQAVDLSFVSRALGRPVALAIGKEYFDALAFVFRPGERTFAFGESGSPMLPAGTPSVPLIDARPTVAVRIDGRDALLTIDMGHNGHAAIAEGAAARLGLTGEPSRRGLSGSLAGDVRQSRYYRVGRFTLGPATMRDVEVKLGSVLPGDRDGVLGMAVLSRFAFALDITARRLWLMPQDPGDAVGAGHQGAVAGSGAGRPEIP